MAAFVRMGQLAFLGSRRVNGVSALHGELMKQTVFRPLHRLFPDRITAITNGVTPRRWLLDANPELAALISETLGHQRWIADLERLEELAPSRDRPGVPGPLRRDQAGEQGAARGLRRASATRSRCRPTRCSTCRSSASTSTSGSCSTSWRRWRPTPTCWTAPALDGVARVKIFAGKAAPSYMRAKLIIKFINDVAAVVNAAPEVRDRLKILFLPNYNVSLAQILIPGADLSEQISTAGMEASGTGNMKFGLNGALTIGTLDGANVEMLERVGPDNIFIFGLTAEEVARSRQEGFSPRRTVEASPRLSRAFELIESGHFSPDDPGRFRPLLDDLRQFRPFHGHGRLRRLRQGAARGRADLRQPGALVAQGGAQYRAHGLVLERPHGARLRARDLAGAARHLSTAG